MEDEGFYNGMEKIVSNSKYNEQKKYLEESVFNRIFLESEKKTINWNRLNDSSLATKIKIQDYSGQLVEIPIFLDVTMSVEGFKSAYLCLFKAKNGPCRNNFDSRVKNLLSILDISL